MQRVIFLILPTQSTGKVLNIAVGVLTLLLTIKTVGQLEVDNITAVGEDLYTISNSNLVLPEQTVAIIHVPETPLKLNMTRLMTAPLA